MRIACELYRVGRYKRHYRQTECNALCLGNIDRTVSALIRRKEYVALVNLLVQFLQEG